jgi:hypothetical protein
MRGIISDEYRTVWTDRAPQIRSGDFVRLWVKFADGEVHAIVKRLRVSRSGTWWGECADGVFQVGTLVQPFAIEKVVALDTQILVSGPLWLHKASQADAEHFAREADELGVTKEWENLGHVDGVPFPGLDSVNYFLSDGCTRNPNYRTPEPLNASRS